MAPQDDEGWVLDERFVAGASAQEAPATERVAQAQRIAEQHAAAEPWRTSSAAAHRRRGRSRRLLPVWSLSALAVVALAVPGPLQDAARRAGELTGGGHAALVDSGRALPPVPEDASSTPLGRPVAPPAGEGGYLLQTEADGARVDPCRPLHWVMRERGAPPGALALVQAQLDRVTAVTGLVFVHDGLTDEGPSEVRDLHQPERYGDRWAPLLVAWSDAAEHPPLADAAALGGSSVVPDGGRFLVAGIVYLDRDDLVLPDGSPAPHAGHVVLHELGHVLGLDHVEDPTQVMHASSVVDGLGDGDLRGLVHAASGPCSSRR